MALCREKSGALIPIEEGSRHFGGQPKDSVLTSFYNYVKKAKRETNGKNKPKEASMSLEGKTPNSYFHVSSVDFKVPGCASNSSFFLASSLNIVLTFPGPVFWVSLPKYPNSICLPLSLICRAVWLCLSFSLQYVYRC